MDRFMNIKLVDATLTDKEGEKFFKVPEIFIKGSCIKYFSV
jgi:small nuclear ribonucleoprotein (snRNP)-like protein